MNKFASIVSALTLSASSLSLAKADQPGPDWMPAQQVIKQRAASTYDIALTSWLGLRAPEPHPFAFLVGIEEFYACLD
jgi:hypothetical protein